jgi:membrane protease YdiL (CAAX protease family)
MSQSSFPWPIFAALLALGLIAVFLSLPFPPKLSLLLAGLVVLGGVVGGGLLLANKIGLRVSTVESWLKEAHGWPQRLGSVGLSLLAGAGLGTVILLSLRLLFLPILPQLQSRFVAEAEMAVWKRIVIAFDSAILEEFIFRLFLFSLLAWLLGRIWHTPEGLPTPGALWAVNVLAAIAFGLAHLPRWTSVTPLTPAFVAAILLLNGVGGVTFGYLYFTHGLEAAILAHFAGDFVLHVVGPGFLKT